ncbi:MAG: regulatory protein RecX [Desulfuromonadaceae bacterium]|nr:regulatory protein RecX [Desulfuromonas sp.]MDY0185893.1 regulatory protein RecX [Desulfuromonadaceae bacterium]
MGGANAAYAHALRLLSVRSRSSADLRRRLGKKDYPQAQIDAAIARCRELDYINDPRTACERARALTRSGKVGPRIRLELRKEGFEEQDIEEAAATSATNHDEHAVLTEVFTRRFDTDNTDLRDPRQRRRIVNYLQRRGFALNIIFDHINERQNDPYAEHE